MTDDRLDRRFLSSRYRDDGFRPACMDDDELEAWRRANGGSAAGAVARPCADCLAGFALEMRAIDRCNGTPEGVEDDEPETPAAEEEIVSVNQRALGVELAYPCGTCAKADVCAIRPTLESGLQRVEVLLPAGLDPRISVRLEGALGCEAYVRARPAARPKVVSAAAEGTTEGRRAQILDALVRHGGNITTVAAELGERPNVIARIRNAAAARGEVAS